MTKCDRCGHQWQTKSTHVFVSCPSCYKKVKIREFKEVVGVAPTKTSEVDQETISKILYLNFHGKSLDEIKSMIENQTDYNWSEIPEKIKKQLKT